MPKYMSAAQAMEGKAVQMPLKEPEPGGSQNPTVEDVVQNNSNNETKAKEEQTAFVIVQKGRGRQPRRKPLLPTPIMVNNFYEALSDTEEDSTTSEAATTASGAESLHSGSTIRPGLFYKTQNKTRNDDEKAQPIIIAGKVPDHQRLLEIIRQHTKGKFLIKYTKNNTNLYLDSVTDKITFMTYLTNTNTQYHTYTDNVNKTHSFVLKGLLPNTDLGDLTFELRKQMNVIKATNMNTQQNDMYMIITDKDTTLQQLQKTVKTVLHVVITWDRVKNARQIVQCHRCQMWGHATTNCGRNPRCLKCGRGHFTTACERQEQPAICANCGGAHIASSTSCRHYVYAVESRQPQRQPAPVRYVPAPAPTTNPWTRGPDQAPTNTMREYPELRQPRKYHQQAAAPPTPAPRTTQPQQQANGPQPRTSDPQQLHSACAEAFAELNSHVNLGEMLRAITDLNMQLRGCTDKGTKFNTYMSFMNNIHTYSI